MTRTRTWIAAGLLLSLGAYAFGTTTSIDEESFPDDPAPSAVSKARPAAPGKGKAARRAASATKAKGKAVKAKGQAAAAPAQPTAQVLEVNVSGDGLTIKDKDGMTSLLPTNEKTQFTRGPENAAITLSDVRPGDAIRYTMAGTVAEEVHVNVYAKKDGAASASKRPAKGKAKQRRAAKAKRPKATDDDDMPRVIIDSSDHDDKSSGDSERGGDDQEGGQSQGGASSGQSTWQQGGSQGQGEGQGER